ncbi:MAG: hypothetical protein AAFZ15_11390 [Bacteroidota bacterium]
MNQLQNLLKIAFVSTLLVFVAFACKKDATEGLIPDTNTQSPNNVNTSNFMDSANGNKNLDELCFQINYPVNVLLPDGSQQVANDDDGLFTIIEAWYDSNPDSDEDPTLEFPINVTLEDGTTQALDNEEQLEELFDECFGEYDDEEWCFTLNYPVTVVYPDGTTASANSDEELEMLFDEWETNNPNSEEYPTLQFPVEVTFDDGTTQSINDEEELEELFDECYGDWDDDEYEICFEIAYPITVLLPDGTSQVANDDEELDDIIFNWYENNPDSDEDPTVEFPIEVTLEGETITVNNEEELEELWEECDGEWDDEGNPFEECFTVTYPVTVNFPDGTTAEVNSDEELEMAIDGWYDNNPNSDEDPTLAYPIELTLVEDGTVVTVNSDEELEEILEECFECMAGNPNKLVTGNDQSTVTAMTIKRHKAINYQHTKKMVKALGK